MLYLVRLADKDTPEEKARFWINNVPHAEGVPYGTSLPSRATHLTYDQADGVCSDLMERGYSAVVTNIYGEFVTLDDLDEARTYVVGSVLRPGLYFVRWGKGHPVMTKQIENAFQGSRSVAETVAEDLGHVKYQVEVLELPANPRANEDYFKAMHSFWADQFAKLSEEKLTKLSEEYQAKFQQ